MAECVIETRDLRVQLNKKEILHGLDLQIPKGKITVILGPNGCGKSTTLKALCRLLAYSGSVRFDGQEVSKVDGRQFARRVAILAQNPQAPADLRVEDLVKMGRFPYRSFFGSSTEDDYACVEYALKQTGMMLHRQRVLSTLSGGERQRAWIAMALAQKPEVLFLDEPTSYLDICHQLEVMNLVQTLNRELGLTVVMVLHDITQALACASHVVVIRDGSLMAQGAPVIVDGELLKKVFGVRVEEFSFANGQRVVVPASLI